MSKRPRLNDFGKQSHLTANAMVKLLEEVRQHGVPDASSNDTIRRHRQRELARDSGFGPIIRDITEAHVSGSGVVHFFVAHPLAAFQRALEVSEPFREFVAGVFARSTSVRIALYADEVTPGQRRRLPFASMLALVQISTTTTTDIAIFRE